MEIPASPESDDPEHTIRTVQHLRRLCRVLLKSQERRSYTVMSLLRCMYSNHSQEVKELWDEDAAVLLMNHWRGTPLSGRSHVVLRLFSVAYKSRLGYKDISLRVSPLSIAGPKPRNVTTNILDTTPKHHEVARVPPLFYSPVTFQSTVIRQYPSYAISSMPRRTRKRTG